MSRLSELIPTPAPESINSGYSYAKPSTMIECLGKPRGTLTTDCAAVTNARLKSLIVTANVGPFRVTGIKPAIESLKQIFAKLKAEKPQVYAEVKTAGMLCCRAIRGSKTSFSNHSWGTAIDLYFGDYVDTLGDDKTQRGLLELYPYFRAAGWFWGAEFSREDSMHFEVSDETMRRWKREGKL